MMIERPLAIEDHLREDVVMTDLVKEQQLKEEDLSNYVTVDGIFIKQDFDHLIVSEDELEQYTSLTKSTMKQTLFVPFPYDIQILNFYMHSYFAEVQVEVNPLKYAKVAEAPGQSNTLKYTLKFVVEEIEVLYFERAQMLQIEWVTSPKNDLVADSLSLLVLQINDKPTPQLLSMMESVAEERQYDEFVKKLMIIFQSHFESAILQQVDQVNSKQQILISHSGRQAIVDTQSREVLTEGNPESSNEENEFKSAIEELIKNLLEVHAPVDLNKHCCC